MATQAWTDSTLGENVIVQDVHFRELIEAINDWEEAYSLTESHYTQPIYDLAEDIDYTEFTEVDPATYLEVSADTIIVSSLPLNSDAYVYKDYGVSGPWDREFFSVGVRHELDINVSSIEDGAAAVCWGLTNTYNESWYTHRANLRSYLFLYVYRSGSGYYISIEEGHSGGYAGDSYSSFSLDTDYYIVLSRKEVIGTYGRLYCYIYSDPEHTDLIDTLQIDLHDSFVDYRYLYALRSFGSSDSTTTLDMTIKNLKSPERVIKETTIDEMQDALDTIKTLVDGDTFSWNVADPGDIITGGEASDFVDQLRTSMEYFQDDNCYLCHTCDTYTACSCDLTCYSYSACSCNNACYGQSCTCNVTQYSYSCGCYSTCYLQTKSGCTCNNTIYNVSCGCYNTCYGQSCTCNLSCYGYSACSCDSSCYGYACSKCDITDYEYPWS